MGTGFPSGTISNASMNSPSLWILHLPIMYCHSWNPGLKPDHSFREIYDKLMASLEVSSVPLSDAGNDSVSALEHILNPPLNSRLVINPLQNSKLSYLHQMGFFQLG